MWWTAWWDVVLLPDGVVVLPDGEVVPPGFVGCSPVGGSSGLGGMMVGAVGLG